MIADAVVESAAIQDESKSWAGPMTGFEDSYPREKRQVEISRSHRIWLEGINPNEAEDVDNQDKDAIPEDWEYGPFKRSIDTREWAHVSS